MEGMHGSLETTYHFDRVGEELRQDGHRVGDVDHLVVLDDLSDEIPRVEQVRDDGHTYTQRQHVGELLEHVLNHGLCAWRNPV